MGVEFSSGVPTKTMTALTYGRDPSAKLEEAADGMARGLQEVVCTPGVMHDPKGRYNLQTKRFEDDNGTVLEWMFCKQPGTGPQDAARTESTQNIGAVEVDDPNKRPPTLPDHLGQAAYLKT